MLTKHFTKLKYDQEERAFLIGGLWIILGFVYMVSITFINNINAGFLSLVPSLAVIGYVIYKIKQTPFEPINTETQSPIDTPGV